MASIKKIEPPTIEYTMFRHGGSNSFHTPGRPPLYFDSNVEIEKVKETLSKLHAVSVEDIVIR